MVGWDGGREGALSPSLSLWLSMRVSPFLGLSLRVTPPLPASDSHTSACRTLHPVTHPQAHLRPACHAPPAERSKSSPPDVVIRPRVPVSRRRSPRCAPSATLRRSSAATSSMRSLPKPVTMRAAFATTGTASRRDTAAGTRACALAEEPGWSTARAATLDDRRNGCTSSPVAPRPVPTGPHTPLPAEDPRPPPRPRPRLFPPPRPALKPSVASNAAGVSAHTGSSDILRSAMLTSLFTPPERRRFGKAPAQPSEPFLSWAGTPGDSPLVAEFLHTRRDGEAKAGDADTASRDGLATPTTAPCSARGVSRPIVVFLRTRRDGVSGSRALEATRRAPASGLASISSMAPSSGLASS